VRQAGRAHLNRLFSSILLQAVLTRKSALRNPRTVAMGFYSTIKYSALTSSPVTHAAQRSHIRRGVAAAQA
jgi:hypothetical protein